MIRALSVDDGLAWCRLCSQVRQDIGQQHRYAHSIRVARFAERLAQRHGLNPKHARIAGLLHDICRLWPAERLLAACAERKLLVDAYESAHPIVLHARLGALVAQERYGVDDASVLQAIERHTLGAIEMTPLDTVVYLADALEPGRVFARQAELAKLAFDDLQMALIAVYSSTKTYLERRNVTVAPGLIAALERHERTRS